MDAHALTQSSRIERGVHVNHRQRHSIAIAGLCPPPGLDAGAPETEGATCSERDYNARGSKLPR
jgi:hypothetical protein